MGELKNKRHEAYARARGLGRSRASAYYDAGYTGQEQCANRASFNIEKRPEVQQRISEHGQTLANRVCAQVIVNKNWVISQLLEIFDRCMQAKPHYDRKGKPDGQWVSNTRDALAALHKIGLELDMFEHKLRVRHEHSDIIEGTAEEIVRRLVKSILGLGTPAARMVMEGLEEAIGPRPVRVVEGTDRPVGRAGEAACELLPAPSEAG